MGFAPPLPDKPTTTKYLRQDGTWVVPPDNTHKHTKADVTDFTHTHTKSDIIDGLILTDYAAFDGTGTAGQNQAIYTKTTGIDWIEKSNGGNGKYYIHFNHGRASDVKVIGSASTGTNPDETYFYNLLHFMQGRYDSDDDTVCISTCNKDGIQTDGKTIKIYVFG
jgi:hypothetical protein